MYIFLYEHFTEKQRPPSCQEWLEGSQSNCKAEPRKIRLRTGKDIMGHVSQRETNAITAF